MSQETDKQRISDISRQYFVHMKYNAVNSITDGIFFTLGTGMASGTVLTYFVSTFTSSNAVIGLLTTLHSLLVNVPQFFVAPYVEKKETYKPALKMLGFFQRVVWLLLGISTFLLAQKFPVFYLVLLYFFYGLFGLFTSACSVLWISLITKVIPHDHQARFFGVRYSLCGAAEILGSFAASMIFKFVPYPTNYGIIFVIVFILLMVSYYFMSNVYELPTQVKKIRQTGYFSRIKEILIEDRNFLMYFISTVAIILGKAGFSFQVIYAKVKLGISSEQAAFIATGIFISQTAGYIFWSYINTKFNYKKSIEMSSLLFIPAIVAMLLMDNIFMLYVSVALFGFAQSARNSGENNLVIAICPREQDKPAYVGLRNTLLGPFFAFVPLLAGVVADIFNYEIMFMGSIIFVVIGYILMKFFVKLEK